MSAVAKMIKPTVKGHQMATPRDLTFLELLQSHRRGEVLSRADELLEELVEAVATTGESGELTIKLPFKVNKAGQIEITPQLSMKKPRPPLATGIYFASETNRLTRSDPRQMDIEDEIERRRAAE